MSLNFKKGIAIAIIEGGRYDGEVLYVNPDIEGSKVLKLSDGVFQPLPKEEGRFSDYIVGKSGSGKSTLCASKAVNYHLMFPDNNIYLFSRLQNDPAFDKMEKQGIIKRIVIDQSLIDEPIDIVSELKNCLVIFDDVDTYADNNLMKAIDNVRDQILQLGRHNNISIMNCSHNVSNTGVGAKITRILMNELHSLIFFNKSANFHQIKYCLKKYFGFTDSQIEKIVKNKSTRWTLINTEHPQYILTENIAALTN